MSDDLFGREQTGEVGVFEPADVVVAKEVEVGRLFAFEESVSDKAEGWIPIPVYQAVPFDVGENLAATHPDLVEFYPVQDAAHVRAWNEDPTRFSSLITGFLGELGQS